MRLKTLLEFRIRPLVNDVLYIFGMKILQYGYYDSSVGNGGHINSTPVDVVFTY